jgi:hypothetical protein
MIYRLNLQGKRITTRWPIQPPTPAVRDMIVAQNGLIYALT